MKRILITFVAFLVLSVYNNCDAQALLRSIANKAKNKLEERASKKAEEQVDKKIDEEIDKQLDNAVGKDSTAAKSEKTEEEKDKERANRIMGRLGVNSTPVKIEESYSFSSNIKMEMENLDKKGKQIDKNNFNTFFNDNNDAFAYEMTDPEKREDQKGLFIFDQKNMASIILSEEKGEKTGIATGLNVGQVSVDSANVTSVNGNLKRTGSTKKILGYSCDEYLYEDQDRTTSFWVTKDKEWKTYNFYRTMYKNSNVPSGMPNGFIMESDTKSKQTGGQSIMRVTEINENIKKKIDLKEYQISNMGTINIGR